MTHPGSPPSAARPAATEPVVSVGPAVEAETDSAAVLPAVGRGEQREAAERVSQAVADQLADQLVRASAQAKPSTALVLEGPRNSPPTVDDDLSAEAATPAGSRIGRPPRLQIGWHTTAPAGLAALARPRPTGGLLLGSDDQQQPVPVQFFRAEPTRVALIGGVWAAQLLAMRALAMGATVVVMTYEPETWNAFRDRAVAPAGLVVVLHGEQAGRAVGTPRQPILVVYDLDSRGPSVPVALGPWQTQLTVLRRLSTLGVTAVNQSEVVIAQRLTQEEAMTVRNVCRLGAQDEAEVQGLADGAVALISDGAGRMVSLESTSVERDVLGPARR